MRNYTSHGDVCNTRIKPLKKYYSDGVLKQQTHYWDNGKEMCVSEYYHSGQKESRKIYYKDGILKEEIHLKNNGMLRSEKRYDKDGVLGFEIKEEWLVKVA